MFLHTHSTRDNVYVQSACSQLRVSEMTMRLKRMMGSRRFMFYGIALLAATGLLLRFTLLYYNENDFPAMITADKYVVGADRKVYEYNRDMPLIFIGGVPRSGTTLMRAMLDAHPDIRCGQETRVIPRLLQISRHWLKSEKESMRLEQAGVSKAVLDSAIAAFSLEIIAKHGEPAARLCNKDPLTIKMGTYVVELFPNAKFIFMTRDGRATVHSIISRKVTITGFDLTNYRQCLKKWNSAVESMHMQCKELGPGKCLRVPYEQLVLHPKQWMEKVLKFLDIPWNESVLHHEDFINNGIKLSKVERSSDQVIKPVNLEALTKWVGNIPDDVIKDMADIAPMLSVLGYDPYANPPNYGTPDSNVADNTRDIQRNSKRWEEKAREMFKLNAANNKLLADAAGGGNNDGDAFNDATDNNNDT
ncbi:protein-tyrosine sulfotransferase [Atheta coriaria]|uniref:protein-tyrosine sulfotransferase n=1 Tax=Dalotia coriaria TaxID=877792 RepID=UPI0031F3CAB4